jgi:hypothetical protein
MDIRLIKNCFAGLALCLLCACSNTRLAYNCLDWIVTWYLDDYLSLNSRQDDFYDQRLKALLKWHRNEQLDRYSRFASQLQLDMRTPVNAALLRERSDSLKQFWHDILNRAAPDCAALLLMLDRKQRSDLYSAMEKKQNELETRYRNETPSRRKKRQFDQAEKPLERFLGPLAAPQKATLERWADDLVPLAEAAPVCA